MKKKKKKSTPRTSVAYMMCINIWNKTKNEQHQDWNRYRIYLTTSRKKKKYMGVKETSWPCYKHHYLENQENWRNSEIQNALFTIWLLSPTLNIDLKTAAIIWFF